MTPTKLLVGQVLIVFAIVILGVWIATQWAAAALGFQSRLGEPWFSALSWPVYYPWRIFEWWYAYEAYAPELFNRAGAIAASSGIAGCAVAVVGSLWRARQSKLVTTYGSSRWATRSEIERAGLFRASGVFLGRLGEQYLRHDGPEHVMAFAPTRSGKGVGLVVPTLLSWTGSTVVHDIKGDRRLAQPLLALPALQPDRSAIGALQPAARGAQRRRRGARRPEHRRYSGRSGRRA
jgi:type IV secretion system protein VirD4